MWHDSRVNENLIFEYLSGGGFCAEILPPSLAREGLLMLNALLNDFSAIPEHELYLLLDYRYLTLQSSIRQNVICLPVQAKDNILLFLLKP